jgi:hypothetical protein
MKAAKSINKKNFWECDFNIYSFSILNSPVGVAADVMFLHVSQQRGSTNAWWPPIGPSEGFVHTVSSEEKYPEPAAHSLGGTLLFAIGVAIVIEVQGTILLQIFLLLLPDSILVDPIINIIPWKFPTNCGHSAITIGVYIYIIMIRMIWYNGITIKLMVITITIHNPPLDCWIILKFLQSQPRP